MNLAALRTEVLNHGFDAGVYGARINQFINDANQLACRRAAYYNDESTLDFSTISGTSLYPQPSDWARDRSIRETDTQMELTQVSLRDIDQSPTATGAPLFYSLDGTNYHLYPTPDQAYPMEIRYWKLPALLVNDTDTPAIPDTYQRMLIYWGCKECFAADDDTQMSQYWEQQFNMVLAEFQADVKFPTDDAPNQIRSMWPEGRRLGGGNWSVYGSNWG